jgi:hypothetical protein
MFSTCCLTWSFLFFKDRYAILWLDPPEVDDRIGIFRKGETRGAMNVTTTKAWFRRATHGVFKQ